MGNNIGIYPSMSCFMTAWMTTCIISTFQFVIVPTVLLLTLLCDFEQFDPCGVDLRVLMVKTFFALQVWLSGHLTAVPLFVVCIVEVCRVGNASMLENTAG